MAQDQDIIRQEDRKHEASARPIDKNFTRDIKIILEQLGRTPGASTQPSSKAFPGSGQQIPDLSRMGGKPMNVFDRLSLWWENRKTIKRYEFEAFKKQVENALKTSLVKDVAELKVRMDRLELFVGLKREPKPVQIPGEARIS